MIKKILLLLCMSGVLAAGTAVARADQLSVVPVLLEMQYPAAAGTLSLRNGSESEAQVQVRVFRWVQVDGKDVLEPTADVVVSPPSLKMAPNSDYVVRVVRTTHSPIAGVENYRVLVDQIPNLSSEPNTVKLLVRQSIPVFFRGESASPPNVSWMLSYGNDGVFLTASNRGDGHLRIADLMMLAGGKDISFGMGLNGYVLGRSTMSWPVPTGAPNLTGEVQISAATQQGAINGAVGWQ